MAKTNRKSAGSRSNVAKTPSTSTENAVTAPDLVESDQGGSPGVESDSEPDIQRLAIPIDKQTRKILYERMRPGTRDELRRSLALSGDLAPGAASVTPNDVTVTDEMSAVLVNVVYDAISSIAIMVARAKGFDRSDAELLRYTAEEKQAFIAPTMRVLAKYDLTSGKYADEIMLTVIVGMTTANKIQALSQAAAQREPIARAERVTGGAIARDEAIL